MKMSEKNYKIFKDFFDYTVENADDEDMAILIQGITDLCRVVVKEQKKQAKRHAKEPKTLN